MADISSIQLPSGNTYDIKDSTARSAIPTKVSQLTNDSGFITGMTILSYGRSTWNDFIEAYNANKVVYCRASSNANPASGSQTRLAFMAYVNNATTPTNVEFQYYRSVSSHTASQQGDQVFVYKLDKTSGWSVTTREASVKVVAGDGLGGTYSNGTMTLTGPTKVSDLTNDSGFITSESDPVFTASAAHGITSANITNWNNKGTYSKPSGGIPKTDLASAVQTSLGKADTALQSYTETDPTVPSWAKASSKPSYTASEVGAAASSHTHGNITNSGDITTNATIANGDRLVINDESASKVINSSITFGTSTSQYLANNGTWQSVPTVPTKLSAFTDDLGSSPTHTHSQYLTSYTETDPTVPSWAKASSKPTYTKSEVGLGNVDNVKQYSASNPPPYPVTSVNGNTGAVTVNVPTKVSQLTNDSNYYSEPTYGIGTADPITRPLVETVRANRLAFLPASQIIIEQTTDGGTTWTDAGVSDSTKAGLFAGTRPTVYLPLLNNARSTNCGLRVTITAMRYNVPSGTAETAKYNYWNSTYVASQERYCSIDKFWFWISAAGDRQRIKVEAASGANPNNWRTKFDTDFGANGWSGSDWVKTSYGAFGGGTNQTGNEWNWRITFFSRMADGASAFTQTSKQAIHQIMAYGENVWVGPNNLMKTDRLYAYDANQNATFPAKVTATTFSGSATLTGTPTAPTASAGTNNTQIATTAFVKTAIDNAGGGDNNFSTNSYTDINGNTVTALYQILT